MMHKSLRNIMIVGCFAVAGGWFGIFLNHLSGDTMPPMESPGVLFWLITPVIAGLLLRAFGGDGWKDSGFALKLYTGWKWYLVAVLSYPIILLLMFVLASQLGAIRSEGFSSLGLLAYVSAVSSMLAASVVKNIFEELLWRGYLTPRLDAAKVHPLLNHLIVGLLWWAWHLPYYLYFLDPVTLQTYLPPDLSLQVFLMIALVGLFPTAIFFGELRLVSQSVWPAFILHNMLNAFSMPLIINGFIQPQGVMGLIFTPSNDGILTSMLFGGVGLMMYRYRIKKPLTLSVA